MVAKLTVIFFIVICLQAGILLMLLPWINFGILGDWGNNYLLAFVTEKTGLPILRQAVASNWFRGAITGLGILNLFIAFWEIAHFKQSVRMLESKEPVKVKETKTQTTDESE
jgi:hypothetical protein